MSQYAHAEMYQKLTASGGNWDVAVAYYKKHAAAINYEIAARERERIQNAAIPPHCPQDIADEAEATARYLWQCRAEAKRQTPLDFRALLTPADTRAPFPAAALFGRVMQIGIRYER